ncbi:MAG: class I SAM-dependent methyltransferase [Oligoflexus sp.]
MSLSEERSYYCLHENNVHDLSYQKFVQPLFEQVIQRALPLSQGLDYGCGDGPVLSYLLEEKGFAMVRYDPYFLPDESSLKQKYDFIVCCEVAEHFFLPLLEFRRLLSMLKSSGFLGLMTQIYRDDIDFGNWHYRRDPTHVSFYTETCIKWIAQSLGFSKVWTDEKQVVILQC